MQIPVLKPQLPTVAQLRPYLELIDKNRLYTNFGPLNSQLELRLADEYHSVHRGRARVVTASSGTSALEILIQSLRLKPGTKILVPALTFVATGTAIKRLGYQPVVCDIEADTCLMTPDSISGVNLEGVSAAIPVATFGIPQDAQAWSEWAAKHRVKVVIDAAAAYGAQKVFAGVPAAFSLHATKPLCSAEGGFVMTTDEEHAAELKRLSGFGLPSSEGLVGTNAKLSEYHAAIALASLDSWQANVATRCHLFNEYRRRLKVVNQIGTVLPGLAHAYCISVLVIQLSSASARAECERLCAERGIETRRWYTPLLASHPALGAVDRAGSLPIATDVASKILGLPFFLSLGAADIEKISNIVNTVNH